jgi:hypothetical protein
MLGLLTFLVEIPLYPEKELRIGRELKWYVLYTFLLLPAAKSRPAIMLSWMIGCRSSISVFTLSCTRKPIALRYPL